MEIVYQPMIFYIILMKNVYHKVDFIKKNKFYYLNYIVNNFNIYQIYLLLLSTVIIKKQINL